MKRIFGWVIRARFPDEWASCLFGPGKGENSYAAIRTNGLQVFNSQAEAADLLKESVTLSRLDTVELLRFELRQTETEEEEEVLAGAEGWVVVAYFPDSSIEIFGPLTDESQPYFALSCTNLESNGYKMFDYIEAVTWALREVRRQAWIPAYLGSLKLELIKSGDSSTSIF